MFQHGASDNKIDEIHVRALGIVYKDSNSNIQKLLGKSTSVSVHQKSLQLFLVEIYNTVQNFNPAFMTQLFEKKDGPYSFRENNSLALPKAKTTLYGIDNIRHI